CLDARRQSAIQPGDVRKEPCGLARFAGVVFRRSTHDDPARLIGVRGAHELPARNRRLDRQRRAASGEGGGCGPPDCRIRGVSIRMNVTRRQFVKGGVAAFTVTFAAPDFLNDLAVAQGAHTRNLVVLNLSGGNDALSMLIPYNDAAY